MTNFDASLDFETNDDGHIVMDFNETTTLNNDIVLINEEE